MRRIFPSSSIRFFFVCSRPAVSTMRTSRPRALAAATPSYTTAAGSAPGACFTMSAPDSSAHRSSCWSAAARNVSAAARTTERPSSRSCAASLPIVVVFPTPLTPVISQTLVPPGFVFSDRSGCPSAETSSSLRAAIPSATSLRARIAPTIRWVAATPTSARSKTSSSSSHSCSVSAVPLNSLVSEAPIDRIRRRGATTGGGGSGGGASTVGISGAVVWGIFGGAWTSRGGATVSGGATRSAGGAGRARRRDRTPTKPTSASTTTITGMRIGRIETASGVIRAGRLPRRGTTYASAPAGCSD